MRSCSLPGCHNSAMVARDGKQYRKCHMHRSQQSKELHARLAEEKVVSRDGETVQVVIVDYPSNALLYVQGIVLRSVPMPSTEGEMREQTARAAGAGMYVARPHPFRKSEDIVQS